VDFENFQHCSIGAASLEAISGASGDRLRVSGMADDNSEGVDITLPTAASWETDMGTSFEGDGHEIHIEAVSEGNVASTLDMVQAHDDFWDLSATFTNMPGGSTYTVNVYDDGVLRGSQSGVGGPEGGTAARSAADNTRVQRPPIPPLRPQFPRLARTDGSYGCTWQIDYEDAVPVTLPNGTELRGDMVEFVEEIDPGASYQYREFESMRIKSNVSSFDIWNESIETAD
jgi:hypothetical protein